MIDQLNQSNLKLLRIRVIQVMSAGIMSAFGRAGAVVTHVKYPIGKYVNLP